MAKAQKLTYQESQVSWREQQREQQRREYLCRDNTMTVHTWQKHYGRPKLFVINRLAVQEYGYTAHLPLVWDGETDVALYRLCNWRGMPLKDWRLIDATWSPEAVLAALENVGHASACNLYVAEYRLCGSCTLKLATLSGQWTLGPKSS